MLYPEIIRELFQDIEPGQLFWSLRPVPDLILKAAEESHLSPTTVNISLGHNLYSYHYVPMDSPPSTFRSGRGVEYHHMSVRSQHFNLCIFKYM